MGGFSDDDIRQVREKVNLVDVVGERVQLRKAGRTFKGCCPFHTEKTPSFHVDPGKQLYHCFGCGAGGDLYSFVMAAETLDFGEAVEVLARRIGYSLSAGDSRTTGRRTKLFEVCEEAACFYERALRSAAGGPARAYIKKRGLEKLVGEFHVGFSPDWKGVVDHLRSKGFSEAEITLAGIAARSEKGGLYDRLRGRVVFPILDNQGRAIAFGGRVLDDSTPKYLNSPETPLYHKGSVFYGLSQAKTAFAKTDTAIVVEGYTDLLALAGADIRNVVATLGTAFTPEHLNLLGRFVNRAVLVFDGDEAGLKAAERSSEYINLQRLPGREALKGLVEDVDTELVVAVMPNSSDPADFLSAHGVGAFAALVAGARPLGIFLIDRIIERSGSNQTGKTKAAAAGVRFLAGLSSAVAKEEYMRYLGERLNVSYEALADEMNKLSRGGGAKQAITMAARSSPSPEREMLRLLLRSPDKSAALADIDIDGWPDQGLRRLAIVLKEFAGGKGGNISDMVRNSDEELRCLVSELALEPAGEADSEDESEGHFTKVYFKCKEAAVARRIRDLKKTMEQTKSTDKKYDLLFEELVALEYKRRELKDYVADGGSLWVKN